MEPASEQPTPTEASPDAPRTLFFAVLLCFVLSGFAALCYQTAWLRQFSIVFGTSELAVATVLAAYMAGLALGAAVGGKLVGRVKRPVLTYGLLELGVAVGALLVPVGLSLARGLQAAVIGGSSELPDAGGLAQPLFYLAAAFVVILIPTTFMGATLPLLTRHAVRRDSQIGRRVGLLYAMNTAGAVGGTVVAAFWLLPSVGLANTVYVGVAVNAVVFLIAAGIAKAAPPLEREVAQVETPEEEAGRSGAGWILPLILISGVTSFTYEVLWTRLLGQVLGGSIFAFATMLASFLVGITLGSAVASIFARTRKGSALGFLLSQVGVAGLSMFVWGMLDGLPERFAALEAEGTESLVASATIAALVLLPAALCIGATFPFALRVLAEHSRDAGPASARVYSWNTVGAIVGAVLAGFLLIPGLGFPDAARIAIGTNLALAFATALLFLRSNKLVLAGSAAALVGGVFLFRPVAPENLLRHSYLGLPAEGRILYDAVGRSATVLTIEQNGSYEIRSNGLPEAQVTPEGAPPFGRDSTYNLATLPVIARPNARSMLVIGFGGGVTLEAIPPSIQSVDAIELEPEILEANAVFADRRRIDPMQDPRLNVVLNDARGALSLTDKRWGIIISQPSHPWTAGASHLYTREFLDLVKEHLDEGGVFVQWMNVGFLDEELFGSIGNTLLDAFENVRLYQPVAGFLSFLASDGPLELEREVARTGEPMASAPEWWSGVGIWDVHDVAAKLSLEESGLRAVCGDAPVSTDDRNVLAMSADRAKGASLGAKLFEFLSPHDPLLDPESELYRDLGPDLDRRHLAFRMAHSNQVSRAVQCSNILETRSPLKQRTQGSLKASYMIGQWDAGRQDFRSAFQQEPSNLVGRFLVVRDDLPAIAQKMPGTEQLQLIARGLSGGALVVYQGWQHAMAGQLQELRGLEAELAAAKPVDPWYVDAARLRAYWRVQGTEPAQRKQAAEEALRLLDDALVLEPNPNLLMMRIDAALAAERHDAYAETLNELAQFIGPMVGVLPPQVPGILAQTLTVNVEHLATMRGKGGVPDWRIDQVESRIREALAGLQRQAGAPPAAGQ